MVYRESLSSDVIYNDWELERLNKYPHDWQVTNLTLKSAPDFDSIYMTVEKLVKECPDDIIFTIWKVDIRNPTNNSTYYQIRCPTLNELNLLKGLIYDRKPKHWTDPKSKKE